MRKWTAFLAIFLLVGCSSGTQIEELAITLSTGIDEEEGIYKKKKSVTITSEILNTENGGAQEKGGGSTKYFLESVSAENIRDAFIQQTLLHPKEVLSLHNKAAVFGETTLQNGITDIVIEISRSHSIRGSTYLVAAKGKAHDLLKSSTIENQSISDSIIKLINRQGIKAKAIEIFQVAAGKQKDSVITLLDTVKSEGKTRLVVSGAAVLKRGKLAGYLNQKEMKLVALLQNQEPDLHIKVMYKNKPLEVALDSSHFKLNSLLSNNTPKFIFNGELSFMVNIAEFGEITTVEDLSNIELLIRNELNRALTTLMKKTIVRYHCDVMGFGDHLYRYRPAYWKKHHNEWSSILPEVDVKFKPDVTINTVGMHA